MLNYGNNERKKGVKMRTKDRQSGRSMIETLGYIAVVMVVAAGIGNLVASAYSDYKLSKASLQLGELVSGIVKASAADADYEDVVNKVNKYCIKKTLKLPKGMSSFCSMTSSYRTITGKECMNHAFGGEACVAITNEGQTGTNNKLAITFAGLNKKQCVELAMKDWVGNKLADLYAIKINNNYWYWKVYENDQNELPVKRSKVAGIKDNDGQCKNSIGNSIMWVFN